MTDSAKRLVRVVPVTLVGLTLVAGLLMREPLSDVFARRVEFNAVGLLAVTGLTLLALGSLVASVRARTLDPDFRGFYSETLRMAAVVETVFMAMVWATILATEAF